MKKIISMILVVLAFAALLSGCKANKPSDVNAVPTATPSSQAGATLSPNEGENIAKATLDPNSMAARRSPVVFWDAVRAGGGTEEQLTYKIYTDYDQLIKEIPAAAELTENCTKEAFERVFVIAVFRTVRTGGYTVSLNRADIKDGVVKIDIGEQAPESSAIVTTAFETHCVLIGINRSEYKEGLTCELSVNQTKSAGEAKHK